MPRYSAWVMCSGSGGRYANVAFVNPTDRITATINMMDIYSSCTASTFDRTAKIEPANVVSSARGQDHDLSVQRPSKCRLLVTIASSPGTVRRKMASLQDRRDIDFTVKHGHSAMLRPRHPGTNHLVFMTWDESEE